MSPTAQQARRPIPRQWLPVYHSPMLPKIVEELNALLQEENERRTQFREHLTADQKQEFINGEIVMHSPAKLSHNLIVVRVVELLRAYNRLKMPGAMVLAEKALIECSRNDYEPDVVWYGPQKAAALHTDMMILPPPDLAIEVTSPSTEDRDRGVKLTDYALSAITEYWIIDPETQTLEQYQLRPNTEIYPEPTLHQTQKNETLTTPLLPNLQLTIPALFDETHFAQQINQITQ